MRYYVRFAVLVAAFSLMGSVQAWNRSGHMTISLIAYDQMKPETKDRALALLRKHERFDDHFEDRMPRNVKNGTSAEKNRWIFAHSSTWPDQVRSSRSRQVSREDVKAFNRPAWHYINFPHYLDDDEREELEDEILVNLGTDVPSADKARRKMNVIQAYKFATIVLGSPNTREFKKAKYLCWLLHLGQDAHQPLHSTALFTTQRFDTGDKGGNSIEIKNRSMHSVWDGFIAGDRGYNSVQTLAVQLQQQGDSETVGSAAAATLDIEAWIEESHELAKEHAYTRPILSFVESRETHGSGNLGSIDPGDRYYETGGGACKKRAVEAGYRLAKVLDGLLGD